MFQLPSDSDSWKWIAIFSSRGQTVFPPQTGKMWSTTPQQLGVGSKEVRGPRPKPSAAPQAVEQDEEDEDKDEDGSILFVFFPSRRRKNQK